MADYLQLGGGSDEDHKRAALAYAAATGDPMDAIRFARGEFKVATFIGRRHPDGDEASVPDWYAHERDQPDYEEFAFGSEPVEEPDHRPQPRPRPPIQPGEPLYARQQPVYPLPLVQEAHQRGVPVEQLAAAYEQAADFLDPVQRIHPRSSRRVPREREPSEYDYGTSDFGTYYRARR